MKGSGLVRVHSFMSGSGFAISARGAAKLLDSLPCYDIGELRCSPAVDVRGGGPFLGC